MTSKHQDFNLFSENIILAVNTQKLLQFQLGLINSILEQPSFKVRDLENFKGLFNKPTFSRKPTFCSFDQRPLPYMRLLSISSYLLKIIVHSRVIPCQKRAIRNKCFVTDRASQRVWSLWMKILMQ